MSKPELIYMLDVQDVESDIALLLEVDRNTHELYVNKQKVVTDIQLNATDRKLAWCVAISSALIAVCSFINTIHPLLTHIIKHTID